MIPGIVFVIAIVAVTQTAHAGVEPSKPDAVRVDADSITYEGKSDVVQATGDVGIRHQNYTLMADKAKLHVSADILSVEGGVRIIHDDGELTADRAVVDFDAQTGIIYNGRLHVKEGNFRLSGMLLEKKGEAKYHIDDAIFTTCDGDRPSWKFSATDVDLTVEDYAVGKNAFLYISDVPVFYLPYVVFPVKRERQSGFLIPRIGTSTKKGFFMRNAWYQVIAPNQDATVSLDLQTRRGAGTEIEYRYMRSLTSTGELDGYLIYDLSAERWRGNLQQKHEEIFSPTMYFKSSINAVTDRTFHKDFGEAAGEYNKKILESSIFLTKYFDYYSVTPQVRYAQIIDRDDLGTTFQKLPMLTARGIQQPLGSLPVYFSVSSDFTSFMRDLSVNNEKNVDVVENALRGRVRPQLTWNFNPAGFLDASVWGAVEGRVYSFHDGDSGTHVAGSTAVGATLSTTLFRSYDRGEGALLRHFIVPRVDYVFADNSRGPRLVGRKEVSEKKEVDVDTGETISVTRVTVDSALDNYDDPVDENRVIYSIGNYLKTASVREDGSTATRDLLALVVSQSFLFGGGRRDLLTPVDREGHVSDLRIDAVANPTDWLGLRLDTRIDLDEATFSTANVGVDVHDRRGNTAVLSYRFTEDARKSGIVPVVEVLDFVNGEEKRPRNDFVNYAEARLKIASLQPFTLEYIGRYSFDRQTFLESLYSVEYRHQCWSLGFTYRDNSETQEFLISLNLAGLGSAGKMKLF